MSNIFWKSFHLCFSSSLIKCLSPPSLPSSSDHHRDDPTHPSLFINNFNFLYDYDDNHHVHCSHSKHLTAAPSSTTTTTTTFTTATTTSSPSSSASSFDSDSYDFTPDSPPADFAAVFASQRFFFSSPGLSNSIIESPDSRSQYLTYKDAVDTETNYNTAATSTKTRVSRLIKGGVAVKQHVYSPDPYIDFRRSMKEMVDAMDIRDIRADQYELLRELLFCYLSLNPRHTHKFIIRAFADTLVSLLSESRRKR